MKKPLPTLYTWNKWLAVLYGVQGIALLVASVTKTAPVTAAYLTSNTFASETAGHTVLATAMRHIMDVNLAWLLAGIFFVVALVHALAATVYRTRQDAELAIGTNKLRWVEAAVSSGLTVVAVALIAGISDAGLLFAFLVLAAGMHLTGWLIETYRLKGTRRAQWLLYALAGGAGLAPWLVIGGSLLAGLYYGAVHVPAYVYGVYCSMLVLAVAFAANLFLQYKGRGKWADYMFGERVYMILNVVAKTVLAWLVFAAVLRP
jgi:hypothetical protein